MRVSKKILVAPAALGVALLLALTASATAQDPPSPHDKLAVWAGHWKRHGEVKETQFSHARTFDYDVKCSFLPHGAFMACSSLSLMPCFLLSTSPAGSISSPSIRLTNS